MKLVQATAPVEIAKAATTEPASKDIQAAVQTSVSLLQSTAPSSSGIPDASPATNVSIPMVALTEARRRGYATRPPPRKK
jgi:hypothetical protein